MSDDLSALVVNLESYRRTSCQGLWRRFERGMAGEFRPRADVQKSANVNPDGRGNSLNSLWRNLKILFGLQKLIFFEELPLTNFVLCGALII